MDIKNSKEYECFVMTNKADKKNFETSDREIFINGLIIELLVL